MATQTTNLRGMISILTGAAAAQCHPERQYLVARLIQFGFSVGLEQAEDFKRKLMAGPP